MGKDTSQHHFLPDARIVFGFVRCFIEIPTAGEMEIEYRMVHNKGNCLYEGCDFDLYKMSLCFWIWWYRHIDQNSPLALALHQT